MQTDSHFKKCKINQSSESVHSKSTWGGRKGKPVESQQRKGRYTRGRLLLKHATETRSDPGKYRPARTHEGACSWNRIVQQICPWSLLPHIKPVCYEGAKLGSKSFVTQHIFSQASSLVCAGLNRVLHHRLGHTSPAFPSSELNVN